MAELFDMGKYAAFIWPSYGLSVLVIAIAVINSVRARRAMRARLRALEARTTGSSIS